MDWDVSCLAELADMEEQVPFLRGLCAEARVDLSERITRTVSVYGTADPYAWPADSFHHVQQMEDATSALEVRLAEAVAYRDELRSAVSEADSDWADVELGWRGVFVCAGCGQNVVHNGRSFRWETVSGLLFCDGGTWHTPDMERGADVDHGSIVIREAVCSRCGETFVPCDDDDLEHCVTEMGEPCGGRGTMVGAWHG